MLFSSGFNTLQWVEWKVRIVALDLMPLLIYCKVGKSRYTCITSIDTSVQEKNPFTDDYSA